MKRVFLGWDRPLLVSAVEWFLGRLGDASSPEAADGSDWVAVFPTARAGRRFLELLAQRLQSQRRVLIPPRVVTVGALPELLYESRRPCAPPGLEKLAWAVAVEELRRRSPADVEQILRRPPASDDLPERLQAAEWFQRLHGELAGAGMTFQDVAREAPRLLPGFPEGPRWQAMAELQRLYWETLDAEGFGDVQMARLSAAREGLCRSDRRIVLVGVADPPRILQTMLLSLGDKVTALIAAPAAEAGRFEECGALRTEAWRELPEPPPPERIAVVDQAIDQAAKLEESLREWSGTFAAGEITLGLADESLAPLFLQILERLGVPARYGPGGLVTDSAPWRLLRDISAYASRGTAEDLAALVRHPWVERFLQPRLGKGVDILSAVDRWVQEHVPLDARAGLEPKSRSSALVRQMHAHLEEILRPLMCRQARPLKDWADGIAAALTTLLEASGEGDRGDEGGDGGTLPLSRADLATIREACEQIAEALHAWQDLLDSMWQRVGMGLAAQDWLPLLENQLRGCRLSPKPFPKAVELVGWLEAPWDDAPAVIVTNVNEGLVPSSTGNDPFLPNRLRKVLELNDDQRRFARDAYGLTLLMKSRTAWRLIAARQSVEGDPLLPSRLLFSRDKQVFLQQVESYFGRPETASARLLPPAAAPLPNREIPPALESVRGSEPPLAPKSPSASQALPPAESLPAKPMPASAPQAAAESERARVAARVAGVAPSAPLPPVFGGGGDQPGGIWLPPRPRDLPPPGEMRVTEFRDYLACPYRYYLRHRLRLEACSDDVEELSALDFGSLAHQVLSDFGRSRWKDSSDAQAIADFLLFRLSRLAKERFGERPKPAVAIQVEQLKHRLLAFADKQAGRAAEGWRILVTEREFSYSVPVEVAQGQPLSIVGRVDRIDYHPDRKTYAILDYKLGDSGTDPGKAHLANLRDGEPRPQHIPASLWEKIVMDSPRPSRWVDLQLPLYDLLVRQSLLGRETLRDRGSLAGQESLLDEDLLAGQEALLDWGSLGPPADGALPDGTLELQLGYFLLPKDLSSTGTKFAEWDRQTLDAAAEAAFEVIRCVCRGEYWPPAVPPPRGFDDFNRIIGERIIGDKV